MARSDPLEALYVLALTTGLLQGELLALKWSDLDLTYGMLQVQRALIRVVKGKAIVDIPKSPTARRCIRLPQLAIEALARYQHLQHLTHQKGTRSKRAPEWIFCDEQGVPLQATRLVRQSFQPLLAKADLPAIRFHDLRHSTATLLFTLGVHPKIVQELLGHSQIFVTLDIYSHIVPTLQEEAMQCFIEALLEVSAQGEEKDGQDLFPPLLQVEAYVQSRCSATGQPVTFVAPRSGEIADLFPATSVLSRILPTERCDCVRGTFCKQSLFFHSEEAASPWMALHPDAVLLSLEEAAVLGHMVANRWPHESAA